MRQSKTALIAMIMMLTFSTPTFAELVQWSQNLLVNPGAEEGDRSGWKVWTGSFGYSVSSGATFPYKGNYLFYLHGRYYSAKISQTLDVYDYASAIDNGDAEIKIGAHFKKNGGTFHCAFLAQYLDENGSHLSEYKSEAMDCHSFSEWTEKFVVNSVPPKTRTITYIIQGTTSDSASIVFDDAYFHIRVLPDNSVCNDNNQTPAEITTNLQFSEVKPIYNVGDIVALDLIENLQNPPRCEPVDLWVAIELPDGNVFMTGDESEPFSVNPQAFSLSLEPPEEATEITHRVLEFFVPSGLGGNYTFYATYVKEGSNPMNSFLAIRSNIARKTVVLDDR